MGNSKWASLIEAKREEIQAAGEKAYRIAMENKHLKVIVELYEDGDVDVWHTSAGSNNQTMSSFNGESIQVMNFCYQYSDIEVTTENIIEKLEEKGIYEEVKAEAEENDCNLYEYLAQYKIELFQEIEAENLEWEINEYKYEAVDQKIEMAIQDYR